MATAQQALKVAAGEIGYSRWDDELPGTKYGRWYAGKVGDPSFGASGVPFCAMGVSWVLDQVGMTPPGGVFAYVPFAISRARAAGRLVPVRSAQPGDLACFDWDGDGVADHVGMVELNRGTAVQTIEFNTSSGTAGSQSDGGGVYRRVRGWGDVIATIRILGPVTINALQRHYGVTPDGRLDGPSLTVMRMQAALNAGRF